MPSPFPGMDPFLESPGEWRDVHEGMIAEMRTVLNAILPPNYRAKIDEHLYVMPVNRSIYPDVALLKRPAREPSATKSSGKMTSTAAVADPPVRLAIISDEDINESYIQILAIHDPGRVVTTIELLSPINKTKGFGHEQYRAKQEEILNSPIHLIEIDLLRSGEHTVAPPLMQIEEEVGHWDYLVSLHRSTEKRLFDLWPVCVRERLPRISVPLDEGVSDVVLDLQTVFDRNYDTGAYDRSIDYRKDPVPPLEGEDAAWMDALLRERGLRK